MIINTETLQKLRTGFSALFNNGLGTAPRVSDAFVTKVPSKSKLETYGFITDMVLFVEWIGKKKVKSLSEKAYQLINKAFEATMGIHKHQIQDDNLGLYGPTISGWGEEAAGLQDRLAFEALTNGHKTTNVCYDGLPFFSSNHKVGKETFSNSTGDGTKDPIYFMVLNKPLKPILYQNREEPSFEMITDPKNSHVFDTGEYLLGGEARGAAGYTYWQLAHRFTGPLDADAFDTILQAFAAITDASGQKIGLVPTHVVYGATRRAEVLGLFGAQKLANGSDNINWKAVETIAASSI